MGEQLSCPCHNEQEIISEQHMDIYLAVREGNLAEARLIISSYPMKVNARDEVIRHSCQCALDCYASGWTGNEDPSSQGC